MDILKNYNIYDINKEMKQIFDENSEQFQNDVILDRLSRTVVDLTEVEDDSAAIDLTQLDEDESCVKKSRTKSPMKSPKKKKQSPKKSKKWVHVHK